MVLDQLSHGPLPAGRRHGAFTLTRHDPGRGRFIPRCPEKRRRVARLRRAARRVVLSAYAPGLTVASGAASARRSLTGGLTPRRSPVCEKIGNNPRPSASWLMDAWPD